MKQSPLSVDDRVSYKWKMEKKSSRGVRIEKEESNREKNVF